MSVLQSVWLEVLVLGVAYRSIGCEDEVVFAEDFVLDEEMSRIAGLTELNAAISQLARRFRALNVDREEFVMLKAIALTNSGTGTVTITLFLSVWLQNLHQAWTRCSTLAKGYILTLRAHQQPKSFCSRKTSFILLHVLDFCICGQIFFCSNTHAGVGWGL